MKVPLRWLQEFIDLPTTDVEELSYAFDMLGLTVEGVETYQVEWANVLVGKVLDIAAHPDADKVRVCQVDTGSGPEQIICGAWNFDEGAYVAVAKPGAVLPGDFQIGIRTIRGVESNGMICSENELGIGLDHDGILVLDGEPEVGTSFEDLIEMPDVVFDLDVTPNRPDALSILGVARDLAAYFDTEYSVPQDDLQTVPGETEIQVQLADETGCRRFVAREITGVTLGTAPLRMRFRLHKAGVRSISNVVDVTNYVMFELGHPLHAFDADSIEGDTLVVKRAAPGETLVTLDSAERKLHPDDLIIYDKAGPTSMSGTMGGARSEVSSSTTRVLMEAASWDPPTIMRMWRRHDLRSEAATRFERGVDSNLADFANRRASAMVGALTGGSVLDGGIDEIAVAVPETVIELPIHEVTRILGEGFTSSGVSSILRRLGMKVEGDEMLTVQIPSYRPDVSRTADLLEEIARIHGFDKFSATLPTGPSGGLTIPQRRERRLRSTLTAIGLDQAINLPFVGIEDLEALNWDGSDSDLLTVRNPLREEESKLRPTLLPGLLNNLRFNRSHGVLNVALFEVGRVFFSEEHPDDDRLPNQVDRVAWASIGDLGIEFLDGTEIEADGSLSLAIWHRLARSLGLQDVVLEPSEAPGFHPGRTARVTLRDRFIGYVGELNPQSARDFELDGRVAVAEFELAPLIDPVGYTIARTPSVYPHVDFDLSFLVPATLPVRDLVDVTVSSADGLVEDYKVFDVFTDEALGEGKMALGIRYRLRGADQTYSSDEIALIRNAMIAAAAEMGARLRGA